MSFKGEFSRLVCQALFGEVLANVMGDLRIEASGVFYDIDKYKGPDDETRQYFGPYAYRFKEELGGDGTDATDVKTRFRAEDFAGHKTHYLDEEWFKVEYRVSKCDFCVKKSFF